MSDIVALAQLLDKCSEAEQSRAQQPQVAPAACTPANLQQQLQPPPQQQQTIEPEAEESDSRETPQYDVVMKQRVGVEDVYLGSTRRSNSLHDCNEVVVRVQLPHCKMSHINVTPTDTNLCLTTPLHKLSIEFSQEVDSKAGSAQWDPRKEVLTLTFPLRAYDYQVVS
eukprot:TRINITY_DN4518_c0_g1_i1.p1 TRINITY_DN4518_c0_g1~~TRINITY_DN4518_c0_g1_i1.p1  ORF type:complete len:168 (+),score=63.23 TRINITY_DN4518_c0_g1_i1:103-606(+)